jgi:hypothetical protein
MICPNCNAEAGSGKFCRSCGSPLTTPKKIVCSGCGAEILSTTKFCAKCGTRVAAVEATGGQICTNCNAPLEPHAKFCKSCGQPTGAAPQLAVGQSALAATLPEAPAAALVATQVIDHSTAPSSVASAPQPRPTPPVPVTPVVKPAPVEAFAVEPEGEAISPSPNGRKSVVWTGGILLMAAVAVLTWWFTFRTPPVNTAPIVKGPLYDQPAR